MLQRVLLERVADRAEFASIVSGGSDIVVAGETGRP